MARMYINICLNIHGYFSGVLLCWNFQFLFVTFFFSFMSVDHFQIKPAMADLSLISDTTIFIKIHFDLPNVNIHFFLLKYISVIFTAIARLVTFLNITINIHGHLMCSFLSLVIMIKSFISLGSFLSSISITFLFANISSHVEMSIGRPLSL